MAFTVHANNESGFLMSPRSLAIILRLLLWLYTPFLALLCLTQGWLIVYCVKVWLGSSILWVLINAVHKLSRCSMTGMRLRSN